MATRGMPLRFAGPFSSGITSFVQGALGGGGYADGLSGPATTSHIFVRGNYADLYRWKASSGTCDNVTTVPHMSSLGVSPGTMSTPFAVAVAPSDETRVYAIFHVIPPRLGYQAFGANYGQLYASNDGGDTWYKPGSSSPSTDPLTTPLQISTGNVYSGPNIAVDPLNKDVLWLQTWAGVLYTSYDGGVTLTLRTDLMDLALPKATVTIAGTAGGGSFSVVSNPVLGTSFAFGIGAFDATNPFAIGGEGGDYNDASSSTTLVALTNTILQGNTGGPSSGGDPSVVIGDTIYFGRSGGICIDSSFGSSSNPGGSGVMSNLVYFGWQAGATSLWKTENGATLKGTTTFSVVGSGGPSLINHKMKLSRDATLGGGGNNVLYLHEDSGPKFWRWVRTHPTGSSLTDNTWTSWTNSTIFTVGSNNGQIFLPDPATQGRVLFIRGTTTPNVSLDYGDTRIGYTDGIANINGDTPWLYGIQAIDLGDAEFSLATPGRVFYATGVGLFYSDVTSTSVKQTCTTQMQILQSLIVGQVLKTPAPYSRIVLSWNQDRSTVVCVDENTIPDGYFPIGLSQGAGRACYSLNDPSQIFTGQGIDMQQYAGTSSGGLQNWTAITSFGAHGWPSNAGDLQPISRSSTELMVISNSTNIQYGTLSGGTWSWTNTLFGGSPLVGVINSKFGGAGNVVDIDKVSGIIWYADIAAGTLYKSTDGGATLTRPGAAGAGAGIFQFPAQGSQLAAVPGQTNHLFFANGFQQGSATGFANPGQVNLSFTNDGGATWNHVPGTYYIMHVAVGPTAPGGTYPTVYIFGQLNSADTFQYSLYRCINFNPSTFAGTWVDVGANLSKVECTTWRGGLTVDPDNWAKIYMGSSDNGYVVGTTT